MIHGATEQRIGFMDALVEACMNEELVSQFNRLNDSHLFENFHREMHKNKTPIEIMINKATGYDKTSIVLSEQEQQWLREFVMFFTSCIWFRLGGTDEQVNPNP